MDEAAPEPQPAVPGNEGAEGERPKRDRRGYVSSRARLGAVTPRKKKGPSPFVIVGAAVSLVIAGCCVATSFLAPQWRSYTAADGSFTVSFPGKPEVVTSSFQTPNGAVAFASYTVKATFLGRVYGVQSYEPEVKGSRPPDDARLDAMVAATAKELNGKAENQHPVSLGSYPGREVELSGVQNGQTRVLLRVYVVQDRVFELKVFQVGGFETTDDDRTFLNSFRVP